MARTLGFDGGYAVPIMTLKSLSIMTAASGDIVARIMRDLGLPQNLEHAGPEDEINLADYFRVLEQVSLEIGDETCRLSQRSLMPGSTHFVWSGAAGEGELRAAMKRVAQAYNMLHGGHYNGVREDADSITYLIDDRGFPYMRQDEQGYIHIFLECVLVFLHCTLMLLAGDALDGKLRKVWTRRPRPEGHRAHLEFLGVPIRWNARTYALSYDVSAASLSVTGSPTGLPAENAVYRKIVDLIEARGPKQPTRMSIADRVCAQFEHGISEQSLIARALGMSVATLRRRLADEGVDFRGLKQRALNDRAKILLRQGYDLAEIADLLDYADFRSFTRAFKAQNGLTPAQYKQG
ncbi:hypothetical protein JCM17846_26360 [Iodidimonas nitroreducens]|uniref:HTH araC/xylS-type domain-containing protein n=1 Tax=Iodidimonas nitroreducens TaxID=1236968 RepID=A0A5A7NB50_9PROT|nr:AraC family transcriptional regulator [Iodidimonas nitroreducens]GAK32710.1 YSIRK-targeted surface antigen transcriptional regulator [alpha proteobacterium Q-1]GER04954.1 hypothetical protein JCM17846_26360 [Iodidimonas nitroreducens]